MKPLAWIISPLLFEITIISTQFRVTAPCREYVYVCISNCRHIWHVFAGENWYNTRHLRARLIVALESFSSFLIFNTYRGWIEMCIAQQQISYLTRDDFRCCARPPHIHLREIPLNREYAASICISLDNLTRRHEDNPAAIPAMCVRVCSVLSTSYPSAPNITVKDSLSYERYVSKLSGYRDMILLVAVKSITRTIFITPRHFRFHVNV